MSDDDDDRVAAAEPPRSRMPTGGADDELLADPPQGAPPGGIQGYAAGRRLRLGIAAVVLVGVGVLGWSIKRWKDEAAAEARAPKQPHYDVVVDEGDARPRQLVWNDGPARLGLSRQEPGVEEIVLPDRRLRLAPGSDVAQLKVEVKDGRTVLLKVLVGDILQLPPVAGESPPAPPATAP